jgi:3,4-dihydroxy 2-butanone 4-phosphate synthase/GTP cyclohydrolase II
VVHRVADARLPTELGAFRCLAFRSESDEVTHLGLVCGDVTAAGEPVLVRVHSECLTGDLFGSRRCDCGPQLHEAMRRIDGEGRAGWSCTCAATRGAASASATSCRRTSSRTRASTRSKPCVELGLPIDDRDDAAGATILRELGADRVRLLTNNPAKVAALTAHGIEVVARIPSSRPSTPTTRATSKPSKNASGTASNRTERPRAG